MKVITTAAPKDFDQWMKGQGDKNKPAAPAPAPGDTQVIGEAVKKWLEAIRSGNRKYGGPQDQQLFDTLLQQGVITQQEFDNGYVEHLAEEHDLCHIFVDKGQYMEIIEITTDGQVERYKQ